jgi:hypothetical protein
LRHETQPTEIKKYLSRILGGNLATLISESNNHDDLRQEITKIARVYGVFQCVECSQAIQNFLSARNVRGKRIQLDLGRRDLPWSVIYDLRRQQQIATNGYHEGIAVIIEDEEIIFDNIDYSGVSREEWYKNLTSPTLELGLGSFIIREEYF